ncbi:hypothetical protein KSX_67750 [Ktedonospora formicarum]|uniref:Uncharacterized protein n=1 Tax=Ktedonospora formicarum TaxID=2778364 RepID=A0A8J3MTW3_9CHLR|nr:hypothetical protein KSX_67750 [Ktedonospora formicarum]
MTDYRRIFPIARTSSTQKRVAHPLQDVTQQTAFTIDIDYPSSQMYADFIVEDPHLDSTEYSAPLYPFQRFTSVPFTKAHVRYTDGWHAIGALRMMQVTMIQKGEVIAYPSDIALPDSFTVLSAPS